MDGMIRPILGGWNRSEWVGTKGWEDEIIGKEERGSRREREGTGYDCKREND